MKKDLKHCKNYSNNKNKSLKDKSKKRNKCYNKNTHRK